MHRLLLKLATSAVAGILLFSNPIGAQIPPPQKRAEHVEITKAPELEIAHTGQCSIAPPGVTAKNQGNETLTPTWDLAQFPCAADICINVPFPPSPPIP
jgi:hypothetical protein